MSVPTAVLRNSPAVGIGFVLVAMMAISVNDMLVKQFSSGYPLHQIVFIRSAIGICFSLIMVQFEGGFSTLRTERPGLHLLRCLLLVVANMTFFAALAAIPLADATAMFFVAPLIITLLSIPFLGEKVGIRRIGAVVVGFFGVLIMLRPGVASNQASPDRIILLLPIAAAFAYAAMQILTRRLGARATASAMAVYVQAAFLAVGAGFWIVAGDGRFADGVENQSIVFLLRAWRWPDPQDFVLFITLGLMSAVIGYTLSAAYRAANAATVAPFEYSALLMAVFWGWMMWGELPDWWITVGIVLIVGSGLYVFIREQAGSVTPSPGRPLPRRW